jgi:molybdate transport system ATP-binding protein
MSFPALAPRLAVDRAVMAGPAPIGPLIDRATGGLSGGERQRIALGRALLAQPLLFLMDKPLSALDRMTKEEILPYLEALRTSSSIPALYVSHDMSEIERLADHMVLLDSGRVAAAGPGRLPPADCAQPAGIHYSGSARRSL